MSHEFLRRVARGEAGALAEYLKELELEAEYTRLHLEMLERDIQRTRKELVEAEGRAA